MPIFGENVQLYDREGVPLDLPSYRVDLKVHFGVLLKKEKC